MWLSATSSMTGEKQTLLEAFEKCEKLFFHDNKVSYLWMVNLFPWLNEHIFKPFYILPNGHFIPETAVQLLYKRVTEPLSKCFENTAVLSYKYVCSFALQKAALRAKMFDCSRLRRGGNMQHGKQIRVQPISSFY